jgi:hypothetical protein
VGNVGIAQDLCSLARTRPGEDPVADRRQVRVWAEEVGAPTDRRPDPSGVVGAQQCFGDLGTNAAVRARSSLW